MQWTTTETVVSLGGEFLNNQHNPFMASSNINSQANILARLRAQAAADPDTVQIGAESANAQAGLAVSEEEENLNEKNAFSMAQNAALLNRAPRPVGGGTYAEMRRRRLGPAGIKMSGLGAANRANLGALRRTQIKTQEAGARSQVNSRYGLTASGQLTPAAAVQQRSVLQGLRRQGATLGPVAGVQYPSMAY